MNVNGTKWNDYITPWTWPDHSTSKADFIKGYGGWDQIDGGGGDDEIDGGQGNDKVLGGSGADQLKGGGGQDSLDGGSGRDNLDGGSGNDFLDGGTGNDILRGGKGFDAFVFSTELGRSNVDTITDFNHADDQIFLSQAIFNDLWLGGLSDDQFHKGAGATEGADAQDRIIYDTASGNLYYDPDGSGSDAAVRFAVLTGSPNNVNASDFTIV